MWQIFRAKMSAVAVLALVFAEVVAGGSSAALAKALSGARLKDPGELGPAGRRNHQSQFEATQICQFIPEAESRTRLGNESSQKQEQQPARARPDQGNVDPIPDPGPDLQVEKQPPAGHDDLPASPASGAAPADSADAEHKARSNSQSRASKAASASPKKAEYGASKPAHFLTGRVTHSEVLPALSEGKSVGRLFDPAILLRAHKTDGRVKKFLVPSWLAGTWSRTQATEISRVKLPGYIRVRPGGTSVTIVKDSFGSYRDHEGRIWQVFDPKQSTGEIDRGAYVDYHAVFGYRLVVTGPRSAAVEVQASHAVVDKKTGKIRSFYQDEELNSYSLVADGQVRTDSSVKVFDWHGKPQYLARSLSTEMRTQAFKGTLAAGSPAARKK